MEERPLCKCHGEAKRWNKDDRRKLGGYWRCSVTTRDFHRAWHEANREREVARKKLWRKDNPDRKRENDRRARRKALGWFDEGGMATSPVQFKELT